MNFSVALIAKNESKTLPRLLASLKEFQERGGEVLLCDTGSTDGTADIARSLGCVVYEVGDKFLHKIDDETAKKINETFIVDGESPVVSAGDTLFDYSAARNYIAEFASNDMLATPDCDEAYTRLDLDKVCAAIDRGVEQLEYNFVFSHDALNNPVIKFRHCKFYNRKKLKWTNIIHEVLTGSAQKEFFGEDVIYLEHWQNHETNRSHYLKGLALDCYEHPTNDRNAHYFGRELVWTGRPKSAIRQLEKHIKLSSWLAEVGQSYKYMGDAYLALGQDDKAIEAFHKGFLVFPGRRECLINLATYFWRMNKAQEAAVYAAASLTIPPGSFYSDNAEHYTTLPHEILYWALWYLGNREESDKHFDECLRLNPMNRKYLNDAQFRYHLPKVSIVLPTLGRPEGLQRCRVSIDQLIYPSDMLESIVLDGPGTVPQKVAQGLAQAKGDIICYAANDMEFEPESLMLAVIECMKTKGLVSFNEGPLLPDEGNICTHFVIHRDLIKEIGGEIFDTEFNHVGVDNLLWEKAKKLGKAKWLETAKIKHHHFSNDGQPMDEIYLKGWSKMAEDRELLKKKLAELHGSN